MSNSTLLLCLTLIIVSSTCSLILPQTNDITSKLQLQLSSNPLPSSSSFVTPTSTSIPIPSKSSSLSLSTSKTETCINLRNIIKSRQKGFKICKDQNQCGSNEICYGFICLNKCLVKVCAKGESCVDGVCLKDRCKSELDCGKYEECINGQCKDKCLSKQCQLGCKKSQCTCKTSQNCLLSQTCSPENACLQSCSKIKCSPPQQCLHGICQTSCKKNIQCSKNQHCLNNICTQICQTVKCKLGYVCQFGECVQKKRKCQGEMKGQCGDGEKCQKGQCVGACVGVECPDGQVCVKGVCRESKCGEIICPKGSYCDNGKCVVNETICGNKSYLKPKLCQNNKTQYEKCIKPVSQGPTLSQQKIKFCGFNGQSWQTIYVNSQCEICLGEIKYYIKNQCSMTNRNFVCNQSLVSTFSQLIQQCKGQQICTQGSCQTKDCKIIHKSILCYISTPFTVTVCTQPRPDPNCYQGPDLAPPGPSPDRCAISYTSQHFNIIPNICSPCSISQVQYYIDKPCYNAPFICKQNDICNGQYCQRLGCDNNQQCPYDWQICMMGKCVDRCMVMQCDYCKYGKCGYEENPLGRCVWNPTPFQMLCESDDELGCYSNECIDDCTRKQCPQYWRCSKKTCSAI